MSKAIVISAGRVVAGVLAVIMLLVGCGVKDVNGSTVSRSKASPPESTEEAQLTEKGQKTVKMRIGDTDAAVEWEKNESVEGLEELCRDIPLTVRMSMYGGFEQVGSLGTSLPGNDIQTTTSAGTFRKD